MTNKIWLITGGTGSLGKELVKRLLKTRIKKVIVLSRDEHKQVLMERELNDKRLRFLLGDIRDRNRLKRAFQDVDIVVNCAALKQVPKCERDPLEAKKTNVDGAENIIEAAIDCNVKKVLAISTDKASNPSSTYGRAKALADDLFIRANQYGSTKFSVIRFGNFLGSRGSVIPLFKQRLAERKPFQLTHPDMTRFFITFDNAVGRVMEAIDKMHGGEIFCPKMPSAKIIDIADALEPFNKKEVIGIRDGEKLHEDLIVGYDARRTYETKHYYIISNNGFHGKKVKENFSYNSQNNKEWLDSDTLRGMI